MNRLNDASLLQPDPPTPQLRSHAGRIALRVALWVPAVLILAIVVVLTILLADANVLRGPLSRLIANTLHRPFAINGDLHIGLRPHLHVDMSKVELGNAPWGSRPQMATLQKADVALEILPLLKGQVVLPEVQLVAADVLFERDLDGEPNWVLGSSGHSQSRWRRAEPVVRALRIDKGKIVYVDPRVNTDIALHIDSESPATGKEAAIRFAGAGSLRDDDFELHGRADSLLQLAQGGKPYGLTVDVRAGSTRASFAGTVVPFEMETIDGKIELQGKDLSKLYPLVPIPLPWTSAYRVSGHVTRQSDTFAVRDLSGHVGRSDVEGSVSVDVGNDRPAITAHIQSQRLDYKDLAGALGAPPPARGQTRTPEQRETAQQLQDTGKVLSSKPYSLKRLRAADADVTFSGRNVLTTDIPLEHVAFHLKLRDGKLVLDPLEFGLAGGHVLSQVTLDAHQEPILTQLDATATNLEVKALLPKLKQSAGSAGRLGGRVKLATKGDSVAQMLASGNGELAFIMGQGRMSTLTLVLTNLDLANATKYMLRGDPDAPVYCAVVNARMQEGVLTPGMFIVDSSEENIRGEGDVDFKDEQYGLRMTAKSKHASLVALRGPIRIGGTFKHPEVRPEMGPVALRAGAAVALGALLSPAASLLALIDPGGGKDSNCAALIGQAQKAVDNADVKPPARAAPAPEASKRQGKERAKKDAH